MLSIDEIESLSLNAKLVHKIGNTSFFANEINQHVHAVLNSSDGSADNNSSTPLNFFIRYKAEDSEKYYFSRVERVVTLSEIQKVASNFTNVDGNLDKEISQGEGNSENKGKARPNLSIQTGFTQAEPEEKQENRMEIEIWKKKMFWIAFEVLDHHSGGVKYVRLHQISSHNATAKEVQEFAERQLVYDPSGSYAEDIADVGVLGTHSSEEKGKDSVFRPFLPTKKQIQKLKAFKKRYLEEHTWSKEEVRETSKLVEHYTNLLQRSQQSGPVYSGGAVTPIRHSIKRTERMKTLTQWGIISNNIVHGNNPLNMVQLAHTNSQSQVPFSKDGTFEDSFTQDENNRNGSVEASQGSVNVSPALATLSPFLPKRLQKKASQTASMPPKDSRSKENNAHPTQSSLLNLGGETNNEVMGFSSPSLQTFNNQSVSEGDILAAESPSPEMLRSEMNARYTAVASDITPTTTQHQSRHAPPTIEDVEQASHAWFTDGAEQEDKFYHYINNTGRNSFLDKNASITLKNREYNRKLRLLALAEQHRAETSGDAKKKGDVDQVGNMMWVTDDTERAELAQKYKEEIEQETTTTTVKKDKGKAEDAGAAPGEGADGSGMSEREKEEAKRIEKFTKHQNDFYNSNSNAKIEKEISLSKDDFLNFVESLPDVSLSREGSHKTDNHLEKGEKRTLGFSSKYKIPSPNLLKISDDANVIRSQLVLQSAVKAAAAGSKRSRPE